LIYLPPAAEERIINVQQPAKAVFFQILKFVKQAQTFLHHSFRLY